MLTPPLSTREMDVLVLVCDGLAATDIAEVLGISSKTVEFHKSNIYDKLDVRNVAMAVRYAVREGWIKA